MLSMQDAIRPAASVRLFQVGDREVHLLGMSSHESERGQPLHVPVDSLVRTAARPRTAINDAV